jgi:hypothetical protein
MLTIPLVTSGQIEGVYLTMIIMIALASFEAMQSLPLATQNHE